MRRYMMLLGLVLLNLKSAEVQASWQTLLDQRPGGSQVAFMVEPLDGGPVRVGYNQNLLLPPASTQKLLTALAAELTLGAEYRFSTRLLGQGQQRGANWRGDLKLVFSGAPDLTRVQLGELIERLSTLGIRQIDGNLLLDGRVFSGYERARGWPWDNLGVCYSAPASALTLEHNCVAASLNLDEQQPLPYQARLYLPPHQPLDVSSQVQVVSATSQRATLCELLMERGAGNRYELRGCITSGRKVWPLNLAVNDTAAYVTAIVREELAQRGVRLTGQVRVLTQDDATSEGGANVATLNKTSMLPGWQPLATVYSAPLKQLLPVILQDSDNLYADNLLKTLGQVRTGTGSFAQGVRAVRQTLSEVGIELAPARLADGSGLSRDNLLSAQQLAAVLRYLAQHPQLISYRELPVAGQNGTLQYRRSLREAPLRGQVQGKSGAVNGSRNLAGFITAASGKRYLFVLLHSGLTEEGVPPERQNLRERQAQFERQLLERLYREG